MKDLLRLRQSIPEIDMIFKMLLTVTNFIYGSLCVRWFSCLHIFP